MGPKACNEAMMHFDRHKNELLINDATIWLIAWFTRNEGMGIR